VWLISTSKENDIDIAVEIRNIILSQCDVKDWLVLCLLGSEHVTDYMLEYAGTTIMTYAVTAFLTPDAKTNSQKTDLIPNGVKRMQIAVLIETYGNLVEELRFHHPPLASRREHQEQQRQAQEVFQSGWLLVKDSLCNLKKAVIDINWLLDFDMTELTRSYMFSFIFSPELQYLQMAFANKMHRHHILRYQTVPLTLPASLTTLILSDKVTSSLDWTTAIKKCRLKYLSYTDSYTNTATRIQQLPDCIEVLHLRVLQEVLMQRITEVAENIASWLVGLNHHICFSSNDSRLVAAIRRELYHRESLPNITVERRSGILIE